MKILLIEDDESLASAIREYLKSEDILVEVAQNFQKGQEKRCYTNMTVSCSI